jgi:hypothetical protein
VALASCSDEWWTFQREPQWGKVNRASASTARSACRRERVSSGEDLGLCPITVGFIE